MYPVVPTFRFTFVVGNRDNNLAVLHRCCVIHHNRNLAASLSQDQSRVFLSPLASCRLRRLRRLSLTLDGEHDRLCAAALQHAAHWDTLHSRLEDLARLRPCIFNIAIAVAIAIDIVRYQRQLPLQIIWRMRHYHHLPADIITYYDCLGESCIVFYELSSFIFAMLLQGWLHPNLHVRYFPL